jgi:hypothetical protein
MVDLPAGIFRPVRPYAIHAVTVRVRDINGNDSPSASAPVFLEPGELCDPDLECAGELVCQPAAGCTTPIYVTQSCPAAPVIDLASGSGTVDEVLDPAVAGIFGASCRVRAAGGDDRVYRVTVPAGAPVDLVATTDLPGTLATLATRVALRSVCQDPTTEVACGTGPGRASEGGATAILLDAAPGDYAVIVGTDATSGPAGAFQLRVRLRPVRASGDACDPAGLADRCATGLLCSPGGLCG